SFYRQNSVAVPAGMSKTLYSLPKRLSPLLNVLLTNDYTFNQLDRAQQRAVENDDWSEVYNLVTLEQVFPFDTPGRRRHRSLDEMYDEILSLMTPEQIDELDLLQPVVRVKSPEH